MKTLTKTLGIIGMMTILGTGTMFGSTSVKDKNHKNGYEVVNYKFDKNHKGKKNEFDSKCHCKTCMELMKKMNEDRMNKGKMNGNDMNRGMNGNNRMNNNSNRSGNNNMNNNGMIMNGRR